jgi:hypothetical protein
MHRHLLGRPERWRGRGDLPKENTVYIREYSRIQLPLCHLFFYYFFFVTSCSWYCGFSGDKTALIKKKIKFSSYIRKFSMEQLQSHIWLTASSYMGKCLCISSYIRKPFHICIWLCNFSILIFLIFEEKFLFFFISVYSYTPPLPQIYRYNSIKRG